MDNESLGAFDAPTRSITEQKGMNMNREQRIDSVVAELAGVASDATAGVVVDALALDAAARGLDLAQELQAIAASDDPGPGLLRDLAVRIAHVVKATQRVRTARVEASLRQPRPKRKTLEQLATQHNAFELAEITNSSGGPRTAEQHRADQELAQREWDAAKRERRRLVDLGYR